MKIKIGYYLSHPIQYFSPLLRKMAEEFDLHVYYFSDASIRGSMDEGFGQKVKWDIPLLEGYSYEFLKNISGRKSLSNRLWDAINPSVLNRIFKNKTHIIIINGWDYFSNLLIIFVAKLAGRKVWLRADNSLSQELKKKRLLLFVKKVFFRYILFPSINKFLFVGHESKHFFKFYGVRISQMVYTPHAVDNEFFQAQNDLLKNKQLIKEQLNLPVDKEIILFAGKYIDKKRPLDLLNAFKLLKNSSAFLVMVGEGELRPVMENFIQENALENVVLTGFVNQSQIVKYYAAASIFVMCSGMGETWGLSVNEAMNFSLPVIVSDECGCASDLVYNDINGYKFKKGDVMDLTYSINKLLNDENFRIKCGKASLDIIKNYSICRIVQNIKEATG